MGGWLGSLFGKASLARRLVLGATVWSLFVLSLAAWALSTLYSTQTLRILERELDAELANLTRAIDADALGDIGFIEEFLPSDSRYMTPLSGLYWSMVALDEDNRILEDRRSVSLWDGDVPWAEDEIGAVVSSLGQTFYADAVGPNDDRIRVAAKAVLVPQRESPVLLLAAVDRSTADENARQFLYSLFAAMGLLAASLVGAMLIQVRVGLAPLRRIEQDVADVREGRKTQLADDYPSEVRPLSHELNKLLDHNKQVVERARTHVGNLAHALKTPIAVLMNETRKDDEFSDLVRRQTETMNRNVQHYLKRAQAAARAEALGARTEITPALNDLARLLNRLFGHQGIEVKVEGEAGLAYRGERQDLDDMVGNLMENACKFAASTVTVQARSDDGFIELTVDDDGPGLSEEEMTRAVERGVRLDESAPGTGLGLSIVNDLSEMYGGAFRLSRSPLGGLRGELRLPAA